MNKANPKRLPQPTVLIVDDDPEIARAVKIRLDKAGFIPVVAHGGGEALIIAKHLRPDAMVLDLRMPELDGYAVLAGLHRLGEQPGVPAVILSADVAERARLRALNDGAAYFVEKPYHPRDLIAALNAAIKGQQGRDKSYPTSGARYDGAYCAR
jgi:DNA-binding response OmpR family regulator